MYSLFLRFTTEDKTNGKAEIVVSLAADIELSHKANMVKEFNADTRREKHRGAFAWKVFIAHNISEGDNRRAELSPPALISPSINCTILSCAVACILAKATNKKIILKNLRAISLSNFFLLPTTITLCPNETLWVHRL